LQGTRKLKHQCQGSDSLRLDSAGSEPLPSTQQQQQTQQELQQQPPFSSAGSESLAPAQTLWTASAAAHFPWLASLQQQHHHQQQQDAPASAADTSPSGDWAQHNAAAAAAALTVQMSGGWLPIHSCQQMQLPTSLPISLPASLPGGSSAMVGNLLQHITDQSSATTYGSLQGPQAWVVASDATERAPGAPQGGVRDGANNDASASQTPAQGHGA
jgi:hypothetical protein